jgi:hypothetical protein
MEKVAQLPQLVEEQERDQVENTLTAILPYFLEGLRECTKGGQKGPPPIPSYTCSNSHNAAVLMSPTEAALVSLASPLLELNAPGGENTPAGTAPASGPSVTCTPTVCGASILAKLDAVTVT